MVREAIEHFDVAEENILECFAASPDAVEAIRRFIEGCKLACTANLNWALSSARYKLHNQSMTDSMEIRL
ncbi:hypothetical protein GGR52DRAFT_528172 [Hypoxylon sp. FL1284]|nr:hypothetical protein GGR52DRAFT_528172 [Hypoxylon sp. FL1284]